MTAEARIAELEAENIGWRNTLEATKLALDNSTCRLVGTRRALELVCEAIAFVCANLPPGLRMTASQIYEDRIEQARKALEGVSR